MEGLSNLTNEELLSFYKIIDQYIMELEKLKKSALESGDENDK